MIINKKKFNGIYNGEDVEKETAMYLKQLRDYREDGEYYLKETLKRKRLTVPEGFDVSRKSEAYHNYSDDKKEKIELFWMEVFRRMGSGHDGMSGYMWTYYNFGWLKTKRGRTKVKYRRNDNDIFWLMDACARGDNERYDGYFGSGIIEIGRRRLGKTSRVGGKIYHDMVFESHIDIIVTSKTEEDAADQIIGQKLMFFFDNLPSRLRPSVLHRPSGLLHLGEKLPDPNNKRGYRIGGRNTRVFSKASRPEASEGNTINSWYADEIGKTDNFEDTLLMIYPALADEEGYNIEGFRYLTGVSGDMGKFPDAERIWKNAEDYGLVRWFSPGWYGVYCDEYGNEDVERFVREELTKRNKIINNKALTPSEKDKALRTRQQQYPFTVEESFLGGALGKFDGARINEQLVRLDDHPVEVYSGNIDWEIDKLIAKMTPTPGGKVIFIEPPKNGCKYIMGIDAYGLKQTDEGSKGAAWVFKLANKSLSPLEEEHLLGRLRETYKSEDRLKIHLELGNLPVAYYEDAPRNPKKFADKAAALAVYYEKFGNGQTGKFNDKVMILVETQPSIIFDYLLEHHKARVFPAPIRPDRIPTRNDLFNKWGIDMKGFWAEKRLGELSHYIEKNCDKIYFTDLLNKMLSYDPEMKRHKYDIVDSLGVALILSVDPRIKQFCDDTKRLDEEDRADVESMFNYKRGD